jgi:hypothetical protein
MSRMPYDWAADRLEVTDQDPCPSGVPAALVPEGACPPQSENAAVDPIGMSPARATCRLESFMHLGRP